MSGRKEPVRVGHEALPPAGHRKLPCDAHMYGGNMPERVLPRGDAYGFPVRQHSEQHDRRHPTRRKKQPDTTAVAGLPVRRMPSSGSPAPGASEGMPSRQRIAFRILGPLEIVTEKGPLPLRGKNQRAVLAYLVLHANQVVSISDLMNVLWPENAPPTARKVLQNAISALRKVLMRLGTPGQPVASLLSQEPGYVLQTSSENIDVTRFRLLNQQGRIALESGQPEKAARALSAALGMWRGPALQDLADSGVDWPELSVLDSARTAAQEDYFEAELLSGRHQEIASQLSTEAAKKPSRERTCRLLMLALYRCGHQVEALDAYDRLRQQLDADFGVEPSRALQDLRHAILRQDPALGLRAATTSTTRPPASAVLPPADPELNLLLSLRELVQSRRRPHVVTLVGSLQGRTGRLIPDLLEHLSRDREVTVWDAHAGADGADLADDLRAALRRASPHQTLVVTCVDLHRTGGPVAQCVGEIVRAAGDIPLLIVLTAESDPEHLWPGWSSAVPQSTTITV
ncbi:BTAD domain-containing putative transcriptional regulator [Streptomyces mutabilis]|uniref:AfsR/SARP family transcriptional regulator n=2 Tax=Streptomyces mutabilis TaxID=67332 RepID=UPI00364DB063